MNASTEQPPVFTIATFCHSHFISRSMLFEMWKKGTGPRRMQLGRRILITAEAAAEWRLRMETAGDQYVTEPLLVIR